MVNQYDRIYNIVRRSIDEDLGKAPGSTARDKELASKDVALASANRKARLEKLAANRAAPTTPTSTPTTPSRSFRAGQRVRKVATSRTGRAVRFTGRTGVKAVKGVTKLGVKAVQADFKGAEAVGRFAMRPRRPRNVTRVVHQTAPQPSTHFGNPPKSPEVKL